MAILPILCYPDPRLHKVAQPVQAVDARIQSLVSDMSAAFRQNQFAPGLKAALERVSAQLIAHFPRQTAADSDSVLEIDNLPDSPVVQRHWTSR